MMFLHEQILRKYKGISRKSLTFPLLILILHFSKKMFTLKASIYIISIEPSPIVNTKINHF